LNKNLVWIAILSLSLVLIIGCAAPPTGEAKATTPQCKDRVDNDGDGYCDFGTSGPSCRDGSVRGDPDCSSGTDNSECTSQCSTGSDCGLPGYVGSTYCGGDSNVYRDYRTYSCTTSGGCGTCGTQTTPQLNTTCTNGCTSGVCNAPAAICGNNVTESGEVCDQDNMGGQTCASQGFSGGILGCNSDCGSFVTSGCYTNSCSDTDGGNVPLVQGTVSGNNSGYPYSFTDNCLSGTQLQEFRCSGTSRTSSSVNCNNNVTTVCSTGACS